MNPLRRRVTLLLAATTVWAAACGPFFPDTVLDLPQAALRVRSSCFLDEMLEIDRATGRGFSNTPNGKAMVERSRESRPHDWRLSAEELEKRQWQDAVAPVLAAGMPADIANKTNFGTGQTRAEMVDLACVLLQQGVAPARVGEIVDTCATWRAELLQASFAGPCAVVAPAPAGIPAPPAFPEVPGDIHAYWQAARDYHSGKPAAARAAWQRILDLPADQRRQRGVWAAWMLAKTSPTLEQALPFYQKTCELAAAGDRDALALAPVALGWRAYAETDPVAALKMYFEAACAGDESMLVSLRQRCSKVLEGTPEIRARAAADPLAREIVTACLFASFDGPFGAGEGSGPRDAWLALLEQHPPAKPSPAAAKAAWLCYGAGNFDAARRWLKQAPAGAGEVLWLHAKLALRDGRLDQAARLFAKAAPFYQLDRDETALREPHIEELLWFEHRGRRDWMRGQFLSDNAIVHVARGEFLRAMGLLAKAGYREDAAYLAERVLTTDELVGWVKAHCPAPPADRDTVTFWIAADGSARPPDGDWQGNPFRYVLARRLAREFRFREAGEFMPPALQPLFAHYVKLHRAARSDRWTGETRAVILWHLARLRRHLGMEFFGYDGAPDNTRWGGDFVAPDLALRRERQSGWHVEWENGQLTVAEPRDAAEHAVPAVCAEETERIARHLPPVDKRFHYRYAAAAIAWQAAALLPDNHQGKLHILHEAGRWLAARDPRAADPFYQELVKRCRDLPDGRAADKNRWFLPSTPICTLPELPQELRFTQPEIACGR